MNNKLDELFKSWNNGDVKITKKVPMCLVLDISGSMCEIDGGTKPKIVQLNENVDLFINYVRNDKRASKICDLCIITFGEYVKVVTDFDSIDNINVNTLSGYGGTPLGEAMYKAIELLEKRKKYYKENDIMHFKPIVLLMSDGEPTDQYMSSAKKFSQHVLDNKLKIFPVGMGKSFNCSVLKQFSPILEPKQLSTEKEFSMLFNLLSSSSSRPEEDPLIKWWTDEA